MGVVGLEWVATMGCGTKSVENHWPRRFSQNNEQRLDSLPIVLLYSVKKCVCGLRQSEKLLLKGSI